VRGADLVVRSSAIQDENPEVQAAMSAGLPVLKRSDFMGQLLEGKTILAVAGTHGKTTTTAMIAWILTYLKEDPSFIVGGVLSNLGTNARYGEGTAFVVEADEYDRMFLGINPHYAVVTNIEHDHPDCYPAPEDYAAAFRDFAGSLRPGGMLIACGDDPGASRLVQSLAGLNKRVATYGLGQPVDYYAQDRTVNPSGSYSFRAMKKGREMGYTDLQVPGEHNVRNALAALAVIDALGLSPAAAAQALSRFRGTGRRFEVRGMPAGITVIDDYAHHPTEIQATLSAARVRYPDRRIWAVWQPHTYSRTRTLFEQFAAAFQQADRVVVTEIYAAREAREPFSSSQVVEAMQHPGAVFLPELHEVSAYLIEHLLPGDVLLVLSAGDADAVSSSVLASLQERIGKDA